MSNHVDESQIDFYYVKSTRELNEGRAAIVRGFGSGAANAIQPVLHPVDAVTDLVVTAWDGMNELSNLAFGAANQASLQRGQVRGRQTVDAIYMFKEASANEKLKIGSEFVGTMLFSYGVGAGGGFGLNKAISSFDRYMRAPVVTTSKNELLFSKRSQYDYAPAGCLDGDLYPPHKLRQLYEYLDKRGADMKPPPIDARGVGFCAIDDVTGKPTLYLWPDSTVLQVKHELSHYLDYKRLGFENYSSLSTFEKEQMVLDRLQNKEKFWNQLTKKEREFSKRYVEKLKPDILLKNKNGVKNVD